MLNFIHIRRPVLYKGLVKGISSLGGFTLGYKKLEEPESTIYRCTLATTLTKENYCKSVGRAIVTRNIDDDFDSVVVPTSAESINIFLETCVLPSLIRKLGLPPLSEKERKPYCLALYKDTILLTRRDCALGLHLLATEKQHA